MSFKRLLIVDDSEIDRNILRNILENDFDIVEADNGYSALEVITGGRPKIDGVLLDIYMPVLDGFNVLRIMKESKIENLPVVLVSANATKPNVAMAVYYKVTDFIMKPFDRDVILTRMKAIFDMRQESEEEEVKVPGHVLTQTDMEETENYISKLKELYIGYLKNSGMDDEHYERTAALTWIIASEYTAGKKLPDSDSMHLKLVKNAAYFYDIGMMAIPDHIIKMSSRERGETEKEIYNSHTISGAEIVWLDHSPSCRFFVEVCGDICMHHHERYDGNGYPHNLSGSDNLLYTQICKLAERFDALFSKRIDELSTHHYDMIRKEIAMDKGAYDPVLLKALPDCRTVILSYYRKYNARSEAKKQETK